MVQSSSISWCLIIILTNNYYTTIILHNTIPGIIGAISALLIIVLYMMI